MFRDASRLEETIEVESPQTENSARLVVGERTGAVTLDGQGLQSLAPRVGVLGEVVGELDADLHGLSVAEIRVEMLSTGASSAEFLV